MSDTRLDPLPDRQAFAKLLASPGMYGTAFLPTDRSEWRGDRFTLGRARRRTPKDLYVGVRLQPADRRNIDRSRERAVQQDLTMLAKSLAALRAVPGLSGVALSRELLLGRDPAGVRRVRFGLVQPPGGDFLGDEAAAAASHASIMRAIRRSGLTIASAPPFDPAAGLAGLEAWSAGVRLRSSRLFAAAAWGKAGGVVAAAVGATLLMLSMIPAVAGRLRDSLADVREYLCPTLATPQDVEATDGVDGVNVDGVRITWDPVDKATGYAIYRSFKSGDDEEGMRLPIATVSGQRREFNDTETAAGQEAFYRVAATTMFSYSREKSSADRGCRGIEAPQSVSASQGTSSQHVEVKWEQVPEADAYEVRRDRELIKTCREGETSLRDPHAPPGRTCQYTVCAKKGAASSCAAATGYRGLAAPENVAASDGTSERDVTVSWNAVPGAASYQVTRTCPDAPGEPKRFTKTARTTFQDDSAEPGRSCSYTVEALNSAGLKSGPSEPDEGWRAFEKAVARASKGTFSDRIRVEWNKVPGATGYEVYRNNADEPIGKTEGVDVVGYDDYASPEGVRQTYAVRPITPRAETPKGPTDQGWRSLSPPSGVTASVGFLDRVEVGWNPTAGAGGYVVRRNDQIVHETRNPRETRFEDRTVEIGRFYNYSVSSVGKDTPPGPPSERKRGYRWLEKPRNVTAIRADEGTKVSWDIVPGATSYEVFRSDNEGPVDSVSSPPWLDKRPAKGPVTYWIRGMNEVAGPDSDPTAETTPPTRVSDDEKPLPPPAEDAE